MATILLSAAGAALGGSIGGSVLGLSMTALGRFAGATLGRAIDQSIMGQGSDAVEYGKVERFRLTNAGEGDPMAQVFGRMRIAGQVIWASQFSETMSETGGGKGVRTGPKTRNYSYSVSLAIGLCEGVISGVGRVWADGKEIDPESLNMRVYRGKRNQEPDAKMEAVEGIGNVPAYRGTAYVVMEDLVLERFGNRVPQFEFEVMRPEQGKKTYDMAGAVKAVALMPGSGEYALATTPVSYDYGAGEASLANVNTPIGRADFAVARERLQAELPKVKATSLIVSWFGNDLRCGECSIVPKVEQSGFDGAEMPWVVAGQTREEAELVPRDDEDRPIYGGTPADRSVIEAIEHLNDNGIDVLYYPFILMDQMEGNELPNPYDGEVGQPPLPWRGRITLSRHPSLPNSPDGTRPADDEIAAFFGEASASDFSISSGSVTYTGPDEWSYRRFILHNAALCAAAGGVDAFSIGSEMRELTKLRGYAGFAAVAQLKALASEARALLGPNVKIGYCADWSEYFGFNGAYGDRYFHLDPLWADPNIDFIGIDNYMPLSDWREGESHADAAFGRIYNTDYLESNVLGGEGYDWYYASYEDRVVQNRTPITDEEHSEPWVWRYKDIVSWWSSDHHERVNGVRSQTPTEWVPQSKPIWFTELGCAAIDKGTNQPNKFLDPKSSESRFPYFSNGLRDEFMQAQYLRALLEFWSRDENNPVSIEYGGPMLDMSRAFVWTWDARPYPHFPAYSDIWSDAANYARGHWITGRGASRSLASVVAEICERAGCYEYDVSDLVGMVEGYAIAQVEDARSSLQPLMLAHGFDAVERDGKIFFVMREGRVDHEIETEALARSDDLDVDIERVRASEAELMGRLRLRFFQSGADFETIAEEAALPDERPHAVASSELPLVMRRPVGRQILERWLSEARIGRDTLRFALPPSRLDVAAGDVLRIQLETGPVLLRVDKIELGYELIVEAVRIEAESYEPLEVAEDAPGMPNFISPVPVLPLFLDLPLITGDEEPHAPHLAVTAKPWPGSAAVYSASEESDDGYQFDKYVFSRSTVGVLKAPLAKARPAIFDHGGKIVVQLTSGALTSARKSAMLNGKNLAAVGDGTSENWELVQFRKAELVDQDTYELTMLLRGQLGTDAWMPEVWPEGSYFVLLDGVPEQIGLSQNARGLLRQYRIGPSSQTYDDASYKHIEAAFSGVGLKPLSPVHIRANADGSGNLLISWIRRTRIDGDRWGGVDVPLGEESESYILRVRAGSQIVREEILSAPEWVYPPAQRAADAAQGPLSVEIAQVSASYGAGAYGSLALGT